VSRVIIFTDDSSFANETERSLRQHAHFVRVQHLSSAVDVDSLHDFAADVILLDTSGNGASVTVRQRLLSDRELQRVPLVVVTNDVAYARLLSAQAMVTKPVKSDALQALVEQLATRVVI
jgi:DNA-binding response OmpR family regulator